MTVRWMRKQLVRFVAAISLIAQSVLGAAPGPLTQVTPVAAAPLAAQTNTLHLRVESARAWVPSNLALHQAIPHYRWLIVQDDTGDPTYYGASLIGPGNANFDCVPPARGGDPFYPENCQWPSLHATTGGTSALVVAEGDETTLSQTVGLVVNPGKYMISVQAEGFVDGATHVDGFKIDGNWFSVPLQQPGTDPGLVTVGMQPYPLPLATLRIRVFYDLNAGGEFAAGDPGLPGFEAHLNDIMGDVTHPISTNWFGDPLCTVYKHDANRNIIFDAAGRPQVETPGGHCVSDANGDIVIKYMAANRYSANVVAPAGSNWVQSTTLEGALDWDIWAQEGWNGFDPEFVPNGEPFPFSWFGFVPGLLSLAGHTDMPTNGGPQYTGAIKGLAQGKRPYSPPIGGIPFGGEAGSQLVMPTEIDSFTQPIVQGQGHGFMTMMCITCGDNIVWSGLINTDGSFRINGVPDGDYAVTHWDLAHDYLDETVATKVVNGQLTDMGTLDQFPWFGTVEGHVCQDLNRNGKCDPLEPGIPNLLVNLLSRDNSLQDSGSNAATTDNDGYYVLREAYPLGQWVVSQAYYEQFYTVGVTYQTNNQPSETTVMANGGFVDVSVYNQVGMKSRLDWAVHTYEDDPKLGPTNGGIVGEMVYNTTRIAQDPRQAVNLATDNQPGIPNLQVHLYAPVKCAPATYGAPADHSTCAPMTTSFGTTNYVFKSDGALMKRGEEIGSLSAGAPIDMNAPYISETWMRPVGCQALDVTGNPVLQQMLPDPNAGTGCLEAPLMSNMVSNNTAVDINGNSGRGQFVNGNYGFTTITNDPNTGATLIDPVTGFPTSKAITEGDWIVEPQGPQVGTLWRPSMEEDINIFSGDQYVAPGETPVNPPHPIQPQMLHPQPTPQIPPHPCVGPTHTVNVVSNRAQAHFDPLHPHTSQGVYNPDFFANHGSPYEGMSTPVCGAKLVTVKKARSATPNFYWMPVSNVQLPGRIHGLITDDLNAETNPKKIFFGEKAGIGNIPIGIYDFANRLVTTIQTDPNGIYEVLLPSTSNSSCPVPASMCPGVYRFVANDPGQPGHLNPGFNPQYRTMAVFQQVWPGITLPSDLAPLPVSTAVEAPGSQNATLARCLLNDPSQPMAPKIPEIYAVSTPYGPVGTTFNITGQYFGNNREDGRVTLEAVADPNKGPTLALNATAGGTLANGTTYDFAFAWRTSLGTTLASPRRHLAADATGRIDLIAPAAPPGAVQLVVYVANHDGPLYQAGSLPNPSATANNTVTVSAPPNPANQQPNLNNTTQVPLTVASWTDRAIRVTVPTTVPAGPHQLTVTSDNGLGDESRGLASSVNGLTFHVIDPAVYNPTVLQAGPGKTYNPTTDPHALQHAVDAAANVASGQVLLVVWPNTPGLYNPFGGYNENVIIHSPVKLQGVGPGGVYPDGSSVVGSVIDGNGFGTDNQRTTDWEVLIGQLQTAGLATHPTPPEAIPPVGEVLLLVATNPKQYTDKFKASVDGLTVMGGDVADFVALLNDDGGGPELNLFDPLDPFFTNNGGEPQGSGIVAWGYTQHLLITNNIIRGNSGAYAGAIRLGTAYVGDNNLDGVQIAHNRIIANGGSNLAGAIGIFAGSDNYSVNNNDICGNFSAEYGGGVSHFGLSSYGRIHDNRIYWNGSYDEGAGIMVAGELPLPAGAHQRTWDDVDGPPPPPSGMSPGSGAVDIYNNVIQGNLSGDDGGGLRLLMVGNFAINIFNNIIANNTATHEGGGVSIDDASNTRFFNNTVIKNITTSTAITSDGKPKPAGLASELNSTQLQNYLVSVNAPQAAVKFSEPIMFNNIFCDNRAGWWDGGNMRGIHNTNYGGLTDPGPINFWDIGTIDGSGPMHPTNSVLQPNSNPGIVADTSNKSCPTSADPTQPPDLSGLVKSTMDIGLFAIPYRGDQNFIGNVSIAVDVPNSIMGDYHLAVKPGNLAIDNGARSKTQFGQAIAAPQYDIDNERRPSPPAFEIGADEIPPRDRDEFERGDGGLGPNWLVSSASAFAVKLGQAWVQAAGVAIWNPAMVNPANSPVFGANQEAYFTFRKVPSDPSLSSLVLKFTGSPGLAPASLNHQNRTPLTVSAITVVYEPFSKTVTVATFDPGGPPQVWAIFTNVTFATADTFMAQAFADGTVKVYKNGSLVGSTNVVSGSNPLAALLGPNTPFKAAAGGGKIGVAFATKANDASFDNFGGGTLP